MTDWTFDGFDRQFDAHVRQQLPWYEIATDAAALIARHYVPASNGLVYDIGCSTGNIGRAMAETIKARKARLIGLDDCADMIGGYQAPGEIIHAKAENYPFEPFDVAFLFLTLMFMPVAERAGFVRRLRAKMKPGGAIVVFDKSVTASGYEATVLMRMVWNGKLLAGAAHEDVARKEMSLAGIQRPIGIKELGPALEVFRFADFAGWIITG